MPVIMPNARFLGLNSHSSGRDWDELVPKIDSLMDEIGLSLAEETIVLIFSESLEAILEGSSECKVFRPVIGSKLQPPEPFLLEDWNQRHVYAFPLAPEKGWQEVLESALKIREQLLNSGKKLQEGVILLLKRRLAPDLKLSLEAVFYE